MKKILVALLLIAAAASAVSAQRLVLLHTNDTHSQIDPDGKNLGGVLRRQVLIDSIRAAEPNVILIDAGDMVQGTLYFTLYGGEAERQVMNALGYDIQIPGNHEFDNGLESLASIYRGLNAEKLSTNYATDGTPLQGLLKPYTIRQIGDKKVGFIAINLNPEGMIAPANYQGLRYADGIRLANSTARMLKRDLGVDRVVAITHIGYGSDSGITDPELIAASSDIDALIGGHSHTLINENDPKSVPARLPNANGDSILITQTGKGGLYLGQLTLDLATGAATEKLIRVDSRLDSLVRPELDAIIAPFRGGVDSLMQVPVGLLADDFNQKTGLLNLAADMVREIGARHSEAPIDLSMVNVGGVRSPWAKGVLTKGQIINSFPFDNRVRVMEISGRDLAEAFDVMAARGGDGVSANVDATFDPATGRCTSILIDGKPLDAERTYILATIDYLANGGDYMRSLRNGHVLGSSSGVLYEDYIDYFTSGPFKNVELKADNTPRMHPL